MGQWSAPRTSPASTSGRWQGKIVYGFLLLLVIIPLTDVVDNACKQKRAVAPKLPSPRVQALIAACHAGDPAACRKAARAFRYGNEAPLDPARDDELLDRACALGDRSQCLGPR
jgi:hypothetical protein